MRLARLTIENIRNIANATIEIESRLNAFYGANGSGKTSILEAVYFLGSGRTFRSHSTEPMIRRGSEECTVFGVVANEVNGTSRLGVSRNRTGGREIRIDGETQSRASALARQLPTLALGPDTVQLLTGAPGERRRFLNWGVFHVEHGFSEAWEQANRCLRQRNRLLRANRGLDDKALASWTRELVRQAEQLDEFRRRYFERYKPVFEEVCSRLAGLGGIECDYYRGWDSDRDLASVLADQQESDFRRGFTGRGYQRADIRVRVSGDNVANVCSRGELKILAWAMVLAQGWLLSHQFGGYPVYLVDDVASELDRTHRLAVCEWLAQTGCQVVATGVDQEIVAESWGEVPLKLFHVEQGQVVFEEMLNER